MTGLIAIDESGDLGPLGTRYFAMAAIVLFAPRDLKKAADLLPKGGVERKWNNTSPEKRSELFDALSELRFRAVYTIVDKHEQESKRPLFGNELYRSVISQVISDAMEVLPCKDVNVFMDNCGFISLNDFRAIVYSTASKYDTNPKKVNKVLSEQNACIQLTDYIVGACRAKYDNGDRTIEKIRDKVSIARRR